jgi:hypothetical protein
MMIIACCVSAALALGVWLGVRGLRRRARRDGTAPAVATAGDGADRMMWRMPPLGDLPAPVIAGARRAGLIALSGYLAIAMILVVVKIILMAVAH